MNTIIDAIAAAYTCIIFVGNDCEQ